MFVANYAKNDNFNLWTTKVYTRKFFYEVQCLYIIRRVMKEANFESLFMERFLEVKSYFIGLLDHTTATLQTNFNEALKFAFFHADVFNAEKSLLVHRQHSPNLSHSLFKVYWHWETALSYNCGLS